jgi:hypothetical protein
MAQRFPDQNVMLWHLDLWHLDCSFQSSLVRLTAVAYPEPHARQLAVELPTRHALSQRLGRLWFWTMNLSGHTYGTVMDLCTYPRIVLPLFPGSATGETVRQRRAATPRGEKFA